jgi:hypothetical protein
MSRTAWLSCGTVALLVSACGGASAGPGDVIDTPRARLEIIGDRPSRLAVDASVTLRAARHDPGGAPLTIGVSWSSSDTVIAIVRSDGRVLARAPGYTRIRAQSNDGLRDSVWVHVASTSAPSDLFTFEFADAVPALQQRAAAAAARRWSEIIPEELSPMHLDVASGACGRPGLWPRAIVGSYLGIHIVAALDRGPFPAGTYVCARRDDGRGALALVVISTDAQYAFYSEPMWAAVWFHELGHALGLAADLVVPAGQPLHSPAMLAGFTHDYGRSVEGISYDRYAHWVGVPGDIMDQSTGTLAQVVGRTTLGRLFDMGYPVHLTQSGPLDLARTAPASVR